MHVLSLVTLFIIVLLIGIELCVSLFINPGHLAARARATGSSTQPFRGFVRQADASLVWCLPLAARNRGVASLAYAGIPASRSGHCSLARSYWRDRPSVGSHQ